MNKDAWEIIKTITEAEHHFNNLCFKIRALASTWLLATFVGVGFLLKELAMSEPNATQMMIMLCWIGAVGIMVLWVLDLCIYQKILTAWFNSREQIEEDNLDFPQMWKNIKDTQPGQTAFHLLKIYYLALSWAPLLLSIYICLNKGAEKIYFDISLSLFVVFTVIIILFSKEKSTDNNDKRVKASN